MMHKKLFLLCLLLAGLLLLAIAIKNNPFQQENPKVKSYNPLIFYDQNSFYSDVAQATKFDKQLPYFIKGGIIPHHLFAGFMIADFFSRASLQKPKTIILIGPNHNELGNFKVLTSLNGWKTPFGNLLPNQSVIQELVKENLLKVDEQVLSNDHAVAGSMPYIAYYLPDVLIVPILLSKFMSQADVKVLAGSLSAFTDKDTIIVAPVDFSHYLTDKEAAVNDIKTLEVIKNFDYGKLFSLNNNYLDSPPSIAVLLMVMQMQKTTQMEVLQHTNSGEMQKNNYAETTSYFEVTYH